MARNGRTAAAHPRRAKDGLSATISHRKNTKIKRRTRGPHQGASTGGSHAGGGDRGGGRAPAWSPRGGGAAGRGGAPGRGGGGAGGLAHLL
jgi:hypothetical protein